MNPHKSSRNLFEQTTHDDVYGPKPSSAGHKRGTAAPKSVKATLSSHDPARLGGVTVIPVPEPLPDAVCSAGQRLANSCFNPYCDRAKHAAGFNVALVH